MLKIAMSGAGGTGKSTIGRKIARALDLAFIPSPMQEIGSLLEPDTIHYTLIKQRDIFQYSGVTTQHMVESFINNRGGSIGFVSERSVFDYLAYAKQYPDLTDEYEEYVWRLYKRLPYDAILFLPIEYQLRKDNDRTWKENEEMARQLTQKHIESILKDVPSVITLTGDSITDKINQAKKEIKKAVYAL